jgi:hypothetical protein
MSDDLNRLRDEAKASIAAGKVFPAIPEPQPELQALLTTVRALREAVEMLIGRRGTSASRAVLHPEFQEEVARLDDLIEDLTP